VTLERRGAAKARTAVYFILILMLWMVKESSAMILMAKLIVHKSIFTLYLYTSTPQALLGEDSDDPVAIHLSR
jgi:hypothetical protein